MAPPNPSASDPSSSTPSITTSASASLPVSALISAHSPAHIQAQSQPQAQPQTITTPSSLLWAHQLRQENIHLSTGMDRLGAMLTKATNAIANLDRNVGQLAEGMHALEQQRELDKQEYDARIQQLADETQARSERAEKLQGAGTETAALKSELERAMGRFSALENENAALRGDVASMLKRFDELQSGNAVEEFKTLENENQTLRRDVAGVRKRIDELQSGNATGKLTALDNENKALRRDVTGMSRGLDELQSDNATLRQRVNVLEGENAKLRGEVGNTSQKIKALETETTALEQSINSDSDKHADTRQFDVLRAENEQLKGTISELAKQVEMQEKQMGRVSELERQVEVQEKQVSRALKWMSMKTMGEDKEKSSKRELNPRPTSEPRPASTIHRTQSDPPLDADRDTIIPDSIPTPPSRRSSHRTSSFPTRTLSETTWGSLSDLESTPNPQPLPLPHRHPNQRPPGPSPLRNDKKLTSNSAPGTVAGPGIQDQKPKDKTRILEAIRQDGRSLAGYLQHTESLQTLCESIPEEAIVMAFQNGLEDEAVKARVIELTGHVGLSWERVKSYLQGYIRDREQDQSQGQQQGKARSQGDRDRDRRGKSAVDTPPPPVKRDATGESLEKRRGKRGRRSIPIIPADEDDDDLFVS